MTRLDVIRGLCACVAVCNGAVVIKVFSSQYNDDLQPIVYNTDHPVCMDTHTTRVFGM